MHKGKIYPYNIACFHFEVKKPFLYQNKVGSHVFPNAAVHKCTKSTNKVFNRSLNNDRLETKGFF